MLSIEMSQVVAATRHLEKRSKQSHIEAEASLKLSVLLQEIGCADPKVFSYGHVTEASTDDKEVVRRTQVTKDEWRELKSKEKAWRLMEEYEKTFGYTDDF